MSISLLNCLNTIFKTDYHLKLQVITQVNIQYAVIANMKV